MQSNQVDYELYDNRLATFAFWSCSNVVKPSQLARAGLIFTGLRDRCACPWCKVELQSWEYFDEPLGKHQKYAPDCKFVKMVAPTRKVKIYGNQLKKVIYAIEVNGTTARRSTSQAVRKL